MNLEGCPRCESSRVYKAHRRGKLERVLVLLGGKLLRCNGCRVRYVRWRNKVIYPDKARGKLRRARQWAMVVVGTVLLVLLLLWLVGRESGSPPEAG